jgi:serine/threonine protein kinase
VREVAIGDVLRKRYAVRGVLGHGGMGTVFEATDEYRLELPTSGKRVAIKVLHTAVTEREELLSELQREFQHLQLLSHPNIVRVHEFDRDGDIAFFTMELLSGALLSRVLHVRNGVALQRPYALAIMRDVGAALAHAHSRGVVHGDINPQNIFITNDAELRVLDFGASHKLLRDVRTPDGGLSQRAPFATPGYASCQLLEGQRPDARDDLFAFACVAYVLLSGQHPFPNRTAVEACAQRLRLSRPPGLSGQQWLVLREGLRWERERRPTDVQNWLKRFNLAAAAPHLPPLSALVNTRPPRKSRMVLATAMIIAFGLLAGAGYWTVTHYDSLAQDVARWSDQARSALASAGAPAAAPEPAPAPAANQTPAPPASVPPTAPSPPPASSARMAPAPRTNPAPSTAPSPMAPSSAAVAPTPSPGPRGAAATRTSAGDTSARTANAGPIRVELVADTVDVPAADRTALVLVRRKGNLHGDANFTWWTESGTAKPGRDFTPVIPREERIADGSSSVSLDIPVSGTPRTQPKSFYVVIDRTESGGAGLGGRTLTMVTLQPPD